MQYKNSKSKIKADDSKHKS